MVPGSACVRFGTERGFKYCGADDDALVRGGGGAGSIVDRGNVVDTCGGGGRLTDSCKIESN